MNTQILTILIDGREWKLVPYIVTPEMEKAADEAFASGEPTWPALLNAAPPTPVASHEPASVSNKAACVSSAGGSAEAAWNRLADEFNQWDTLGADERQTAEDMFAAAAAAAAAAPPPEPSKPVWRGWYCPHCQRGVDGSEVTFHEQHEVCGTYIGDAEPPPPEPAKAEGVKDWPHIANEWADAATNGLQWLKNIREGISTVEAGILNMEECIKHCMDVRATPPTAPAAARSAEEWKPTHRHVERGSDYRVIGEAAAKVSKDGMTVGGRGARVLCEGDRLTVYQGATGLLWVLFSDEFNDGRFVALPGEEA